MTLVNFQSQIAGSPVSRTHLSYTFFSWPIFGLSCFEVNGVFVVGKGKGVEYNGLVGDKGAEGNLVSANNEHGRSEGCL